MDQQIHIWSMGRERLEGLDQRPGDHQEGSGERWGGADATVETKCEGDECAGQVGLAGFGEGHDGERENEDGVVTDDGEQLSRQRRM